MPVAVGGCSSAAFRRIRADSTKNKDDARELPKTREISATESDKTGS
jgi:hypothetical protein